MKSYYVRMKEYVACFIKGSIHSCTNNPSNAKLGVAISMDGVGFFSCTRKGHMYSFVIVY